MYEADSHLRYVLGAHGSHAIVGEIEFHNVFVETEGHRQGFRAFRTQTVITISTFRTVDLTSKRKKNTYEDKHQRAHCFHYHALAGTKLLGSDDK